MRTCKAFLALLVASSAGAADLAVTDGDRLVFTGDSLLYQPGYPNYGEYIQTYLALRNPDKTLYMYSVGRSGMALEGMLDTTTTDYQTHRKWVVPLVDSSPANVWIFSMWADNGGYTKTVFKGHQQTFVDDYIVGISGGAPILLGMIPQADLDGFSLGTDYDDANQEIAEAATPDWLYFKLWQDVQATWRNAYTMTADSGTDVLTATGNNFADGDRVIFQGGTAPGGLTAETYYYVRDLSGATFKLAETAGGAAIDITSNGSGTISVSKEWAWLRKTAPDEVHPSSVGSALAAWRIIEGLGWGTDVSSATVAADTLAVTNNTECTIANVLPNGRGGVNFTRIDNRLPWAIDDSAREGAVDLYPTFAGWQDYSLTVTGLESGTYDVFINGVDVADVTAAELAAGWNMADLTTGPVYEKCKSVLEAVRDLHGISNTDLSVITSPARVGIEQFRSTATGSYTGGNDGEAGEAAHLAACATQVANCEALAEAVNAAAQPETLSFSIQLQGADYTPHLGIPDPDWGIIDPVDDAPPADPMAWPTAESTGDYYIDSTDPSATDTANTYGYPDKPRATIPDNITLGAGKKMVIAGGTYDITGGDNLWILDGDGTSSSAAWVVVDASALVTGPVAFKGSYLIVDGLTVTRGTYGPSVQIGFNSGAGNFPADHVCLRNGEIYDDGAYRVGFGAGLSTKGYVTEGSTTDIVVFNCEIHDLGDDDGVRAGSYEDDEHGIVPGQYTERMWILNSRIYNCGGDSIQPNGNNVMGDARARYIYIAGNEFFHNGENAVDLKSGVDVIVSQNAAYDFIFNNVSSDGTAMIAQQEGGTGSEFCWFIFNDISNCNTGIRVEEAASDIYAIGNKIRSTNLYLSDLTQGFGVYVRTPSSDITAVDNTFHDIARTAVGYDGQAGTAPTLVLHGNIFSALDSDSYWQIEGDSTTQAGTSDYNLYDSADQFRVTWEGTTYTSLATFQAGKSQESNGASGSPGLDANLVPTGSSDALGLSVEHASYAAFQTRYGRSIRFDFAGAARPASGAWTAGAYQVGSGGGGGNGRMTIGGTLTIGGAP